MKSLTLLLVAVLLTACGDEGSDARALEECTGDCDFDPWVLLGDPLLPARALPGRMRLASSRTQEAASGVGNDDHNNFVRETDERIVLLDEDGPGVITRVWFTGRQPRDQDYTVMDRVRLHLAIDGVEVLGGEAGMTLEELTRGELRGFPRPWVAGRDTASNGFMVIVPMAFQESVTAWIDTPIPGVDTFFYYQIDWRELPPGTRVPAFDGVPSASDEAALSAATELWIDAGREPLSGPTVEETLTLDVGSTGTVAIASPTTLRELRFEARSLDDLRVELVVDDVAVVDDALLRWTFAAAPTLPYQSALSSYAGDAVTFRYPVPVRRDAELRISNEGEAPAELTVRVAHTANPPPLDVGQLRILCGRPESPAFGANASLLQVEGQRGHYAGQTLTLRSHLESYWDGLWALEGDHEVFADGVEVLGTGMEDYFGGAFYYRRGPFALPLAGSSGIFGDAFVEVPQYRHHLLDTMAFEESFDFTYESFQPGSVLDYCAYWYAHDPA
ncbi:MAG: DUF2961 domain-containing protein [Myxococcota bacterium]